jgi:hypothetical protein
MLISVNPNSPANFLPLLYVTPEILLLYKESLIFIIGDYSDYGLDILFKSSSSTSNHILQFIVGHISSNLRRKTVDGIKLALPLYFISLTVFLSH